MRLNNYILEQKDKIKIIVLTSHTENGSEEDLYNTAGRIKEECKKRNQECHVIFSEDAYIERDKNNIPRLYNMDDKNGIELNKTNTVVFVRGSVGRTKACLDLLSQIERHEIFCINPRNTIEECSDKYRTVLCLANADIPTPKTALIANEDSIKIAFEKIGEKFPVVLKTLTGSKGIGVFTANDWPGLKSTLQTIWKINDETEIIMQEFVDADYDIRIHVLGNEVIAAMKRFKIEDDFRSNYSLGGKIEEIKLTDEQKNIAIRASKSVNATWSGVDMMIGPNGPIVIEINSSPGTEGIEKATDKNIVNIVLDYIEDKDVWTKKTIECGYVEKLKIKGIGELDAKMDTGNSSYCVIHADSWKIEDDEVVWTRNGKEYTHELELMKDVIVGGVDNEIDRRPVIRLDVEFYGTTYKDVRFTLSNRKGYIADLLINRSFIRKANLVINPAKKFILATNIDEAILTPVEKRKKDLEKAKEQKRKDAEKSREQKKKEADKVKEKKKKEADKIAAEKEKINKMKISKETEAWWNSRNAETQKKHVQDNPNSEVAKLVAAGKLKYGQKTDGSRKSGENQSDLTGKQKTVTKKPVNNIPTKKEKEKTTVDYQKIQLRDKRAGKQLASDEKIYTIKNGDDITLKDKSIIKVDQSKDKTWNKKFSTSNTIFMNDPKNKNMFVDKKDQYLLPSYMRGSDKFNKRDVDLFERLLNSKNADKYNSVTLFSEGDRVGLGTIQSQFGELATMMMISLDDKSADLFYKDIMNHIDNIRGGKNLQEKIVIDKKYAATRDWLSAAYKTRNAMKIATSEIFPGKKPEDIIHSVSWDRPETVESMGFDYSQKEESTDVFVKLKDPKTNKEQMMELSLKKSFKAGLYNGGLADQMKLWGDNTPKELAIKTWQGISNDYYNKSISKDFKTNMSNYIKKSIQKMDKSPFTEEVIKKYKNSNFVENDKIKDVDGIVNDITNLSKGDLRSKRKLNLLFHVEMDKQGNKESTKFLEKINEHSNNYIKDVIHLIKNNSKIKTEVLNSLKENIPLKGILEGRETLFAGQYPITKNILNEIFGTDKWDDIVENIDIETKGKDYYLCYNLNTGEKINVADIFIREDGVGYGQIVKFEMKFSSESKDDSLTYKVKQIAGSNQPLTESVNLDILDNDDNEEDFDLSIYLQNKVKGTNKKLTEWLLKK